MIGTTLVPEKLVITNFNNIESLEVNIPDLLLITGKNGSGKTSIAEALDFCLTGQVMRNVKIADVITVGEKAAEVTMIGTIAGDPIQITRKRTPRSQDLTVIVGEGDNKREIENGSDYLDNIVNQVEFETLYYFNGHDLSTFINSSSETSKMIDKIFSIDLLDTIVSETGRKINKVNKNIEVKKATIKALKQRKEIAEKMANAGDQSATYQAEIEKTREEIQPMKDEIAKLVPDRDKLAGTISKTRAAIREHEKIATMKEENDRKRASLERKIREIEGKERDAIARIDEFPPKEELSKIISAKKEEMMNAKASIEAKREMPKIFEKLLNATITGSECPVCLTPGKKDVALENVEKLKLDTKHDIVTFIKKKKEIESEIEAANARLEERNRLERELHEIQMNKAFAAKAMEDLPEPGNDRAVIDVERLTKGLEQIEADRVAIDRKITKIETGMEYKVNRIKDLETKINALKVPAVTWTDADELDLEGQEAAIGSLSGKVDVMSRVRAGFKDFLSTIRERYMVKINPDIMEKINNFGMEKTPITSFSIVPRERKSRGEVYHYYDFSVTINNEEIPFNALSTGQRALTIIAVILSMIGFSDSVLNAIVFDEIDNCGLDRESLNEILKSIVNLSRKVKILFINRDAKTIDYVKTIAKAKEASMTTIEMPDPLKRGGE